MSYSRFAWITLVVVAALAMICSAWIAAYYAKSAKLAIEEKQLIDARNPEKSLGIRNAPVPLIIHEVDEKEGTITAIVQSRLAGQDIPMRLKMNTGLRVDRQDAIVKDGVVVGAIKTVPASVSDLKKGVRGYGMTSLTETGQISISYLIIGDPFPRP